jgi:hypothetical protein
MFVFTSLFYNNLRGGEMLFEIPNRDVTRGLFYYFKQPFDTDEVIIPQTRKQKYFTLGKYKVDFHPLRVENMSICNRFHAHHSLFDRL